MATSTLKFYLIPELTDENNFILERATEYISGRFPVPLLTINNFQYQRLESSKTIKINASQEKQVYNRPWNYVVIKNSDDVLDQLYFVVGYRQLAQSTIELALKLDVLNMFYESFRARFCAGTFIARAHKNRFEVARINSGAGTVVLAHIFDRFPEGDSPQLVGYSQTVKTVEDRRQGESENFYLIFRTSDEGQPCIDLAASVPLKISQSSTGGQTVVMPFESLVPGRYYYLLGDFALNVQYDEYAGTQFQGTGYYYCSGGFVRFSRPSAASNYIEVLWYSNVGSVYTPGEKTSGALIQKCTGPVRITRGRTVYYSSVKTTSEEEAAKFQSYSINAGSGYVAEYLGAISALDRTASNIVKVIECPYCPIDYQFDSQTGIYSFSSFFETKSPEGFFRTFDLTKTFSSRIVNFEYFENDVSTVASISRLQSYGARFLLDSKCLTSAYYRPTFYYDSFAWSIKLEDYQFEGYDEGNFNPLTLEIRYKQSLALSSSLMFEFENWVLPEGNFEEVYSEQNFDKIMLANRNNEIPLYSSEYLNYLRNGYNYDKKKLSENLAQGIAQTSLTALASVLSFALSPATGGVSAAAGIGLAAGATSSLANIGFSQLQGSEAIEQKIKTLKMQGYSVSGNDDIDLFKAYSGNKLKRKNYAVSPEEESRLDDRFAYYGYACGDYANPYPAYTNTRRFYNFIKVDPVFELRANDDFGEFAEEISDKLRAGVTIWHEGGYLLSNYSLNRDIENVENSIIEELAE